MDYELVNLALGSVAYVMPYAIPAYQYILDKIKDKKREEDSELENISLEI